MGCEHPGAPTSVGKGSLNKRVRRGERGRATGRPRHAVAVTFRDTGYCGRKDLGTENAEMEHVTVSVGLYFSREC